MVVAMIVNSFLEYWRKRLDAHNGLDIIYKLSSPDVFELSILQHELSYSI